MHFKDTIAQEVLLVFPDFSKKFTIHTDASDYQLGAVISQANKPIAFFSRKLTAAQRNYSVGEREMLSIVETLREFRNILLRNEIEVFSDHENLTRPNTSRHMLHVELYAGDGSVKNSDPNSNSYRD